MIFVQSWDDHRLWFRPEKRQIVVRIGQNKMNTLCMIYVLLAHIRLAETDIIYRDLGYIKFLNKL